jgi:hypothetical protein
MLKKGTPIYFWWNSSYIHQVTFVKWCRMRMSTGRDDSNKLGVGAIVESDWLFDKCICPKIPHGLKRGQYRLRPYTNLYRSNSAAKQHTRKIRRPKLSEIILNDRR